jgi:hypothetical protein
MSDAQIESDSTRTSPRYLVAPADAQLAFADRRAERLGEVPGRGNSPPANSDARDLEAVQATAVTNGRLAGVDVLTCPGLLIGGDSIGDRFPPHNACPPCSDGLRTGHRFLADRAASGRSRRDPLRRIAPTPAVAQRQCESGGIQDLGKPLRERPVGLAGRKAGDSAGIVRRSGGKVDEIPVSIPIPAEGFEIPA